MDDVIPEPPMNFSNRYLQGSRRMPNYRYQCKQTYTTVPGFLESRKVPKHGPQYIPLQGPKCPPAKSAPVGEERPCAPPSSAPGGTGYQPRSVTIYPEPYITKYLKRTAMKGPVRPVEEPGPQRYVMRSPYAGMTKGPHGPINKGSLPCVSAAPLPRMTRAPVTYASKSSQTCGDKGPAPRTPRGPISYSTRVLAPGMTKGPTKSHLLYSSKSPPPWVTDGSELRVTKGSPLPTAKGTLPRATKGPRLLVTKVPRFSALRASRSFLSKGSRPFLKKGSQPSSAKGSRATLTKGSQASLLRASTNQAPKKRTKNVKISSTGMKYCSATKWPF